MEKVEKVEKEKYLLLMKEHKFSTGKKMVLVDLVVLAVLAG